MSGLQGPPVLGQRRLPEWVLFNVPHDSMHVPDDVLPQFCLDPSDLSRELIAVTDHHTADLYTQGIGDAQVIRAPFSRLVCDVERFESDLDEPMAALGQGAVYEKTSTGLPMRHSMRPELRQAVIERFYRPHHARLERTTEEALRMFGHALIIDCHSFSSRPMHCDLDQRSDRPQLCIGSDAFHSPNELVEGFRSAFLQEGFEVRLNEPFAGTLVGTRHYKKDRRVRAIMLEANRSLYVDELTGDRLEGYDKFARTLRHCLDRAVACWEQRVCGSDGVRFP